ncbi:MATE family efflux transporter [Novosphingobium profundi]|uniref:MATE family efflux transporter n=1 Tax=Novosphingobium profundi TaxID=1774954 RepID=UPI001BDA7A59|nr:MATE family efflux transporter [Novosphingobium profundi]MBT0667681.1 MATE family efflux transporter [Novosphingobium profundi]
MARSASPSDFRIELGRTLALAGPLALANLLQMAVFAVDVMFVARLGQQALAASSLAVALIAVLMMGLNGVTSACAPLMAAELGRRSNAVREVRRTVRMALWLGGGLSVCGIFACQFAEAIMLLAGQKPDLARMGGGFLAILSFAMVPAAIANVLRTYVSTLGRPFFATAITAGSIAVNALGDYALVFGHFGMPRLELTGAALASIITECATVLAYVVAIACNRRLRRFHIFGRFWRPEWLRLRQMLKLGLPISGTLIAEGGLFSGAAFLMGLVGEAQLAGHTVALQIAAIAFQVPFGIGQAATIRVGYHYGAGNVAGVAAAGRAALLACLAFAVVTSGIIVLFPDLVLSAYVDVADPANALMVAFALRYLVVAAAFQFSDALQAVAAGALRGIQDTRVPMGIAVVGYWASGFAVSVVLGLFTPLEGVGIWLGLAVGLSVAAVLLLARWQGRGRFGLLAAIER